MEKTERKWWEGLVMALLGVITAIVSLYLMF